MSTKHTIATTGGPAGRRSGSLGGRKALVAAFAAVFALLTLGLAGPASAHAGDQSYLYLDVTESSLAGRVEVPMADLRSVLGLSLEGPDEQVLAELRDNHDAVLAYLDEHFDIGADGVDWEITFSDAEIFFSDAPEIDDNYLIYDFDVDVAGAEVPRVFEVRFDPFFEIEEGRDHLLLVGNDWQAGVIDNGGEDLATFDDGRREQTIDLGDPSWVKNFTSSIELGVNHIQTGPDHILFVLVLLLPSVLVFREMWRPVDGFGSALWRVLKVVTMFTVAHSITFTLAGLDLLPLPSPKIVESIIALSIAVAALHNIRPIAANREWLISFLFGLFHGMGFASLVSGLDVSRSTQLVSLLGRNVGIEIGQAVVVLLLFPALYLLRRTRLYRPFFVGVSMLMTLVALIWMVERLFETDLGIAAFVDPVFKWPRILWFIAAGTAVAAGYFWFERSNDRLLAVDSGAPTGDGAGEDAADLAEVAR